MPMPLTHRGSQREPTRDEREAQLLANKERAAQAGRSNEQPVLKNEGQGLSKKQTADLERAVGQAMQWCKAHGGRKYEDPDFPPGDEALYGRGSAESFAEMPKAGEVAPVWKRPSEFMAATPVLTKVDWQVENIRQGQLDNRWLISAINIVSSNSEQLMRVFLDPTKASAGGRIGAKEKSEVHAFGSEHGFYVCRFYHDDPHSDDDWAVVLVDDRLPLLAASGKPCFVSHAEPGVCWGLLLEKAAAKLAGSYAQLRGGTVAQGLKLLTGGHVPSPPRLNSAEGRELVPPSATPFALWAILSERTASNHVVGAAHAAKDAELLSPEAAAAVAEAERLGLFARRAYAVVAVGEAAGHRLLKLRLPLPPEHEERAREQAGLPSEWTGRFSDSSDDWRPQLRQMLSYSRDARDNTFWMLYGDFCAHFNKVYLCRMADDVWSRYTANGSWLGPSAGGGPLASTWRRNPQWLLTTAKPLALVLTLAQADVRQSGGQGRGYATAIGLVVARGNQGAHARRRKLTLAEAEVVATAGPRFAQQVQLTLTLPASPWPYVLAPFAHSPGLEGCFKLTVQADDADDDGVPDFSLSAVSATLDWQSSSLRGEWLVGSTAAGGPPGSEEWAANPQFQLRVEGRATVHVWVDLLPEPGEAAEAAGEQPWPALGLVAALGPAEGERLSGPAPSILAQTQPRSASGVHLVLELAAAAEPTALVLVPYLALSGLAGRFELSVYCDAPHALEPLLPRAPSPAPASAGPPCEFCHAPAVVYAVLARLEQLAAKEARLRQLEAQFVALGLGCVAANGGRRDCGPGWAAFDAQRAQLDSALLKLGLASPPGTQPQPQVQTQAQAQAPQRSPADAEYAQALAALAVEARARLRGCPDVEVDLAAMAVALRRPVHFRSGRAHLGSEADAELLEQLARAVSIVNSLLHGHGRGRLTLLLEGFVSSNAPCLLPCCAQVQGQPEGAPTCYLARARALACKQALLPRLLALDETGSLRSASQAGALVVAKGHRFARHNALPGHNDGANHAQNRRVEVRVLCPDEARAERSAADGLPALPPLEEPDPAGASGGPAGAPPGPASAQPPTPAPPPAKPRQLAPLGPAPAPAPAPASAVPGADPAQAALIAREELALGGTLASIEADVREALGANCPLVRLEPAGLRVLLAHPLVFSGESARFANAAQGDESLTQAAQLLSLLNQFMALRQLPPLTVAVAVSAAAEPRSAALDLARAEACAALLAVRLAAIDGEAEAETRARTLGVAGPPPPPEPQRAQEPAGDKAARRAHVEVRLLPAARFEQIVAQRKRAAAPAADAPRPGASPPAPPAAESAAAAAKAEAAEAALEAERARADAAERGKAAAVAEAVANERKRSARLAEESKRIAAEMAPPPPPPPPEKSKNKEKSSVCVLQ